MGTMESSSALSNNKRIALRGVLIALAMMFSYIESFIPFNAVLPGLKIGLANIVTIYALMRMGIKDAVSISLLRILLSTILFGNPLMMVYSLAGAFLSIAVMSLISKIPHSGAIGIAVCGALSHNFAQCVVAAFLLHNHYVYAYLPILLIVGAAAGVFTGLMTEMILKSED